MSKRVFVISDTHFGHENIIQFCGRPFANADEMDEAILTNWNETVKDDDIIYHLGDVYFGKSPDFLYKLKGRKRLILGNHDNPKDQVLSKVFEKIMLWRKWPEYQVILSHMPLHETALPPNKGKYSFEKYINIHGHIHNNVPPSQHHVNVSVEQTNYSPVELEAVLDTWYAENRT